MQITNVYKAAFVLALAVAWPCLASAHPSGVSFMAQDGEYLVDIGYSPTLFAEDENAIFDFLLERASSSVPYDHVWVRMIQDGRTVLATGVRRQYFGPTSLVYRFPGAGRYVLEASYRTQEGETIASAEFPVDVSAARQNSRWYAAAGLAAALALVALGIAACFKRR